MTLAQEARTRASVDAILLFLVIEHDDLAETIRVVRNNEDVISNGETFYAYPFEFLFAATGEDASQTAEIVVDNISPDLLTVLRSSRVSPVLTLHIGVASAPDDYDQSFENMRLRNVSYDSEKITAVIAKPELITRVAPYIGFTPSNCPGIV